MIASLTERQETFAELEIAAELHPLCTAIVIVPARNEESTLAATLDALRLQENVGGRPLDHDCYEVLLLLNNCTDGSAAVAQWYAADHPDFRLHWSQQTFPKEEAHVGTARRMLMDAACSRLEKLGDGYAGSAILSTDADTLVAPDWIARNREEIAKGSEVVGGIIDLIPEDLEGLDQGTRAAYEQDRKFHRLVARLESLLDPDPADPWPRHMEHFGASLACTPEIYRRCGGLPPVNSLEDIAFVDELRKVGARIRHSPVVKIQTSARLDGRAEVGLSWQLRQWAREAAEGQAHMVDSAEWLEHRFSTLARMRRFNQASAAHDIEEYPAAWRERMATLRAERLPGPRFLELLDCDALIEEMYGESARHAEIGHVIGMLGLRITQLEGRRSVR